MPYSITDQNALKTIINYLFPNQLAAFFIIHNISFNTKFTYDLSTFTIDLYHTSCRNLTEPIYMTLYDFTTISIFTSISISAITIRINHMWSNLHTIFSILNLNYKFLKYINITQLNPISDLDISILSQCLNLKTIIISGCNLQSTHLAIKPHHIKFTNCINLPQFHSFKHLRSQFVHAYTNTHTPYTLSSHNLRHATINATNTFTHYLPKLKSLQISIWPLDILRKHVNLHNLLSLHIHDYTHISTTINLNECINLRDITITSSNLTTLDLQRCTILSSLTLTKCENLHHIKLYNLPTLKIFKITKCNNITNLYFLKNHTHLEVFDVRYCINLDIDMLLLHEMNLYEIHIEQSCMSQINNLMTIINNCTNLTTLVISINDLKINFAELNTSQSLRSMAWYGPKLINIEFINFTSLIRIELHNADLKSTKCFGVCEQMIIMEFVKCHSLEEIDGLSKCMILRQIQATNCKNLKKIGHIGTCSGIYLTDCPLIRNLKHLEGLNIKHINVTNCIEFTNFGFTKNYSCLQSVSVSNSSLEYMLALGIFCPNLVYAHFEKCKMLHSGIRELARCKKLKSIRLIDCPNIVSIKELKNLQLWFVVVKSCERLEYFENVKGLYYNEVDSRLSNSRSYCLWRFENYI